MIWSIEINLSQHIPPVVTDSGTHVGDLFLGAWGARCGMWLEHTLASALVQPPVVPHTDSAVQLFWRSGVIKWGPKPQMCWISNNPVSGQCAGQLYCNSAASDGLKHSHRLYLDLKNPAGMRYFLTTPVSIMPAPLSKSQWDFSIGLWNTAENGIHGKQTFVLLPEYHFWSLN